MKRFVDHTQKLNEIVPEKNTTPKREVKRVDTGIRKENKQIDLDYRVSISPSRNPERGSFKVKPTEVNHFTGRRKTVDDKRIVDIEVQRNSDGGAKDHGKTDDELFVQVGEHTQVFKYGDQED